MIAFALSLLVNFLILGMFGVAALKSPTFRKKSFADLVSPPASVATILPIPAESRSKPDAIASPPPAVSPAVAEKQRFAVTSQEQSGLPSKNPAFIGERDTRAASDRGADPNAAPLPSQAGIKPRDPDDIETTESRYQDGSLSDHVTAPLPAPDKPSPSASSPDVLSPAATPSTPKPAVAAADRVEEQPAPARERLLDGPNPVDIRIPRESPARDQIKPTPIPEERVAADPPSPSKTPESETPPEPARSEKPPDSSFSSHRRKTAIVGSISRTGKSALDVEDSPLGRYQAAISRAVELEWQRNCVRHRDFITPGFLTVRFFVETSGKVRSVQFVGDMETGEIQKGFTLNSIRDAEIPAMPRSLREEYDRDPLELVFRFYF